MTIGRPGDILGDRYELRQLIGHGGYGEVWRAFDQHRSHEVALKLLRNRDRAGAWREASVLTSLRSPHVLEVHNADTFVDVPYLDTALARTSLDRLADGLGMEPHRAVECVRRALRGLDLCHSRGLLHRDVKPANLFEDFNGDVRLGDFGVAVLMDASGGASHSGDPRVRAPEAYLGQPFTVASDVYGGAVTLYGLLAGRWPFDQAVQADLDAAIQAGTCPALRTLAPHVSASLSRVVSRGMSVDPTVRYQSAADFDSALGRLPARRNRFTPIPPHPGHDRCWTVEGDQHLTVCVSDTGGVVAIDVRHANSGRRVVASCRTTTPARSAAELRRLFDQLR